MKRILLAVFAYGSAVAMPAAAQNIPTHTFTKGDAEVMEACLKASVNPVTATELDYLSCVTRAADKCMQEPDGSSTLGIMFCFQRETSWWDRRLNQTYKLLRDNLPDEHVTALRDVQRSWIAFRDTACGFVYDFNYPGSIRQTRTAACQLRETARRAIDLHIFAVWEKLAEP